MKLHENEILFRQAILVTSQKINLPEVYVEKDYWVTLVLQKIYGDEIGKSVVFKGGTALSKCHNIIERFSEDIDLVVFKKEEETGNQLKNKIKAISKLVGEIIPEIEKEGVTNKQGMIRKTAHNYPKIISGNFGQVRSDIIVEASWLGHYEPYIKTPVSSYVFEMMKENNQLEIAETYDLLPFEVLTLDIKRTICEKIMSLVRFSYGENSIADLNTKIRHIYDIHQLLKADQISIFVTSTEFDKMLINVAEYDIISFKNNNQYLKQHPKEALIFKQPEKTWSKMLNTYNGVFKALVYGDFPPQDEIIKTLKIISKRLIKVKWNLKPN